MKGITTYRPNQVIGEVLTRAQGRGGCRQDLGEDPDRRVKLDRRRSRRSPA